MGLQIKNDMEEQMMLILQAIKEMKGHYTLRNTRGNKH